METTEEPAPRSPEIARQRLAAAVAEERLSAKLVLDAWIEREAERRGLPAEKLDRVFVNRVATAERYGDVHSGPLSARLGSLKQELMAKRGLQYNKDATTLGHFLLDDRLQCHSGSVAVILSWVQVASNLRARPVFVHTSGHVQPGLLVGKTLLITEATTTDAMVHKRRLGARGMRVTDALDELAVALLPDPPPWLRERAVIQDAAPPGAKRAPESPDGSPFGFGTADIPPGDLALPRETPERGPVHYGEEGPTSANGENRAGLIAVAGGRGGAAPIFASQPSATGVFNLVFCEDVRPWKRLERANLRALERDLVPIFGSDLAKVRVSLQGECALVGQLPSFEFGAADAEVRLMVRDADRWREVERATIATVQVPEGCQPNWRFCALKPPRP